MIFTVVNRSLEVGDIRMNGVSSSSVFQIGDAESIYLSSIFDTPPESLIIGPFAPLPSNHA
ncbi:spore gernimation protein GerPD [Bacillus halotolerans]|uniref:Spore germination protein GerPD n=1 Tax=Bacillus halotolerans TaxID=260554 RepID=A0A9Q6A7Y0_9BACI|nr:MULTISPECIES: spore germination protein GerPD [Bacillus]MBV7319507.1 spore germination protein GerPD [Halalkalibacterium halodurans]QQF62614.1 spore germination protein GerPD [Bacillus mojavensis]BDG79362.1 putative spore germination protein GerPD [Bacillus subtilis]AZV48312.1 spore gernimation protein GerPD [Bacillus halotolerans]KUP31245.1 spore gernimation protein GerPD [Bacillus halotolerans]